MIQFTIPGPPVPKARARTFTDGRGKVHTRTPERTADYERTIAQYCLIETRGHDAYGKGQPVALMVKVYEEPRTAQKQGDLDNYIKSVSDAINRIAYFDDRQVEAVFGRVFRGDPEPRIVISVSPLVQFVAVLLGTP